jgi:uncharacterized protein (TIGR00106 family)
MVVAGVSVVPVGTKTASVSSYVKDCLRVLDKHKGLKYELTPMATVIEGPLDRILKAIKEMHEVPFSKGVVRVLTHITIDDRRDKDLTMQGKIESVMKHK